MALRSWHMWEVNFMVSTNLIKMLKHVWYIYHNLLLWHIFCTTNVKNTIIINITNILTLRWMNEWMNENPQKFYFFLTHVLEAQRPTNHSWKNKYFVAPYTSWMHMIKSSERGGVRWSGGRGCNFQSWKMSRNVRERETLLYY